MDLHAIQNRTHLLDGEEVERIAVVVRVRATNTEWAHTYSRILRILLVVTAQEQLNCVVFMLIRYFSIAPFQEQL